MPFPFSGWVQEEGASSQIGWEVDTYHERGLALPLKAFLTPPPD
jgi:hypothetical protein